MSNDKNLEWEANNPDIDIGQEMLLREEKTMYL